jgi:SPP1 family predicted phage head-tail adaptor
MVMAAELNCHARIQRAHRIHEGAAERTDWQDVFSCWAKIDATGGREFQAAKAAASHLSHEITIRWRRDVEAKAADRFIYGARVFDVQTVINPLERNEVWMLRCVERVA